jgi:hypothetical protein
MTNNLPKYEFLSPDQLKRVENSEYHRKYRAANKERLKELRLMRELESPPKQKTPEQILKESEYQKAYQKKYRAKQKLKRHDPLHNG